MQNLSISIALCTHNGSAFIDELMASIMAQTILPHELIVCDDASTDSTLQIISRYKVAALFPIIVKKNIDKMGVTQNFAQAISLCKSDVIALCDQDDVWHPEKISIILSSFETNYYPVAVFSDAQVVDVKLKNAGYTIWERIGFSELHKKKMITEDRPWEVLYQKTVITGATLAFKKSIISYILPIPSVWLHDAWIAQICASQGRFNCVNMPLINYRQHSLNVVGGLKQSILKKIFNLKHTDRTVYLRREITRYEALKDRLVFFMSSDRQNTMLKMADEKLFFLKSRLMLPAQRLARILPIYKMWRENQYKKYAPDSKHILADFLML